MQYVKQQDQMFHHFVPIFQSSIASFKKKEHFDILQGLMGTIMTDTRGPFRRPFVSASAVEQLP